MKPFELVVVVGVRLVDRRQVIGVHDEKAAPQGVGGVPVFHPGQSHEQPPAVLARVSDDVTAFFAAVTKFFGAQRITRREPGGGVVGADFHQHLAADAVRFDDARDCQLQGSSISSAPLPVGVHHVDADTAATDPGDECAQRGRGASPATDHLAQVVGMDMHFHSSPTPTGNQVDPNIVGVVDDPADQMLDSVNDDRTHRARQLSADGWAGSVGSGCSPPSAGASAAAASVAVSSAASGAASAASGAASAVASGSAALAAFLAGAFFFGFAASVVGAPSAAASAALNSSSLVGLAGATCRRPSPLSSSCST